MADDPNIEPLTEPSVEELPIRECWELLRNEPYGRLAVVTDDGPAIYPINTTVDGGRIYFRTASGSKLTAIAADPRVVYEVDGHDESTAWSVIVRGTAGLVTQAHEGTEVVELGLTPWQLGPKPEFVRIDPTLVTGRRFERAPAAFWAVPDVHRTTSRD